MLGLVSGTISRYGLVGVGVLCPMCCCGSKALVLAAWKSVFHQWPSDKEVELSAPPVPCLPKQCHTSALMITDSTSEPVNQLQLNVVFIRVALIMVSVHRVKP